MKIFLLLFLFFIAFSVNAQQFLQYNTGTLYDSFENPAQRAFTPDSSRQFSFNFFIPNFSSTGYLAGRAQNSIHSLIANGTYNSSQLVAGSRNLNSVNVAANSYWFMLKFYNRLDGDQEFGISAQTKVEGRGSITDGTFLLLDSYKNFDNASFNNDLFNDKAQVQSYHQLSLTYRQKVSSTVAFGVKLSTLLGTYYNKVAIDHSSFSVQNDSSQAKLNLQGKYQSSYIGQYRKRDILGLKNPGAAVSFGIQAQLENGLLLQGNLRDLGFIRWSSSSGTFDFSQTETIRNIENTLDNDSKILTAADDITSRSGVQHSFFSATDGKAELAISKKYNIATPDFYYTPTVIASKSLFYNGLTAAFVNHFNYKSFWFTALASYNDDRVWNSGAQLMIKSPNAEFFIGSEQLFKSAHFFNKSNTVYASSGISAFIGFSAKFGRFIEHPANASYIPMGEEKGFFSRMWLRIFKRSNY